METWLHDEILDGLTKLLFLSLERTPASDMIAGTAMTWVEALTVGRVWDQRRDTPRVRLAFVELARTREAWPLPKHLIEALPKVETQAIAYELKPATRAEAEHAMAEIRQMLDEPLPDHRVPEPSNRGGPPLSDVEAELVEHYRDRRSAAAGDWS